jgi:hypothetical protein
VGRHALTKVTSAPKGQLRQVRNLPVNVRVKAGLTPIRTTRIGDTKVGPSEPINLLNGGD